MTIRTKLRNWWTGHDPEQEKQSRLVNERIGRLFAETRRANSSRPKPALEPARPRTETTNAPEPIRAA